MLLNLGLSLGKNLLSVPSASGYADVVNSLSPIAYYRLGESSGTTAVDETGNYNLTYTGSPVLAQSGLLSGDGNSSISTNGSTQYATGVYDNVVTTNSPFSVAFLFKRTAPHPNNFATFLSIPTDGEDFFIMDGGSISNYGELTFGSRSTWVFRGTTTPIVNNRV